jgi:L-fuculose-phosphate aldolase
MLIKQAKEEIIKISKKMYLSGMVTIFEGNVSIRLEDRFLITPSQQAKEDMTEDMIFEIDADGNILTPSAYKPSSEIKMHLEAYRVRPDVNAVLHCHSAYATAHAMTGKPLQTEALTEMLMIFGEIPIVPYGRPGTERICAGFKKHLAYNNAVLLANHGVLTVGDTLTKAYGVAEAVEKMAQILLYVKLLGGEQPIPEEENRNIRAFYEERRKAAIDSKRNLT